MYFSTACIIKQTNDEKSCHYSFELNGAHINTCKYILFKSLPSSLHLVVQHHPIKKEEYKLHIKTTIATSIVRTQLHILFAQEIWFIIVANNITGPLN